MDEYDLIIDAIRAVRMVRHHFPAASAAPRVNEIAIMLRKAANSVPSLGLVSLPNELALAVADALQNTYGTRQ
jgi:hypothetical protein